MNMIGGGDAVDEKRNEVERYILGLCGEGDAETFHFLHGSRLSARTDRGREDCCGGIAVSRHPFRGVCGQIPPKWPTPFDYSCPMVWAA